MPIATAKIFKDLLVQAISNLDKLLKLLHAEKQLLEAATAQPEEVEAINTAKNQVLQAIEADINARNEFLHNQSLTPDELGINNYLASLPQNLNLPLTKGWQQLATTLNKVQEANSINGQLINRASQHYDTLINAIQATQSQVKVYSPKGGSGSLNTPRNLGSA